MRAVQVSRFGGPEVLETVEVAEPPLDSGGVMIAVDVVEVLFLDTQLRTGWGREYFPMRPPWVPGTGVAGRVVTAGGSAGSGLVGATVVARTGDEGAYAERVAVPVAQVHRVPSGLDLAVATAALHDGVLALDRLEAAELGPGSRVLVTAAAGSLGHWFVPLAKAAGAHVVAAAGGRRKVAVAAELGADAAVDYLDEEWSAKAGGPFDAVFDGVGGDIGSAALALTADGGTFFGHGAASGGFAADTGDRHVRLVGAERRLDEAAWRRLTSRGLELLADGAVRPTIGHRVPLESAGEAHAAMAARTVIGKTVLLP
jgi:NADPH2:quinone reductase